MKHSHIAIKILFSLSLILNFSFASSASLTDNLTNIEKRIFGRIGVSILNTQTKEIWSFNGNERFPMMSTFKTLACAKLLYDSDNKLVDKLSEFHITNDQIIAWSPVTKELVGQDISLEKACEATMLMSDNTAANIVLENTGGPKALTDFLRGINDSSTRLDRFEPKLNQASPGDFRDTTTPNAMVNTLNKLLQGNTISDSSKTQLMAWMQNNKVSDPLLRSILPSNWHIADRSGAGNNGSRGITAIIWNKTHKPLIVSIYLTQTELSMNERNAVIVEIGKAIFQKYAVS